MHKPHINKYCLDCMSKLDKWVMKDKVVIVHANILQVHNNADIIVSPILLFSTRY